MKISVLSYMIAAFMGFTLPSAAAAQWLPDPVELAEAGGTYFYDRGHNALTAGRTELALDAFLQSCDKGNIKSCFNVGILNEDLFKDDRDEKRLSTALRYFNLACDKGFSLSCVAAGNRYRSGPMPHDPVLAAAKFQQGCEAGEATGCDTLGEMLFLGQGIEKDLARAADYFRKGCDDGSQALSCFNYGLMLVKGWGVGFDEPLGFTYYQIACRRGSASACTNLAIEYAGTSGNAADIEIAKGLNSMACDRGQLIACTNLGLLTDKHDTDPDRLTRAAALYRKACEGGDGLGCRSLGLLAADGVKAAGTKRGSTKLYERGCTLGAGRSCYNAGVMYLIGFNAPKRTDIALVYFARGCDLLDASGCVGGALAELLGKKHDVKAAERNAAAWLAQAKYLDPANSLATITSEYLSDRSKPIPNLHPGS